MPEFEVTFPPGGDPADAVVVTRGPATGADIRGFPAPLLTDPWSRPGMRLLLDHSLLDPTPFARGSAACGHPARLPRASRNTPRRRRGAESADTGYPLPSPSG